MTQASLTRQDILFRNHGLLGVNKPAGTPVHGSRMLEDQPQTLLSQVRKLEGYMVHAIHRLDRPVSGVMPMTGDTTYGRGEHNRLFREVFACHRLLLHAWSLEFLEPQEEQPVRIEAPLDQEFSRIVDVFGWNEALSAWNTERLRTFRERW